MKNDILNYFFIKKKQFKFKMSININWNVVLDRLN
jgi:hypothetical protein